MIKLKLNLAILSIIVAGALAITSCKKKEKEPEPEPTPIVTPDTDQSGADDNNTAEKIDADLIEMGSEGCDMSSSGDLTGFRSSGASQTSLLGCASVTVDTVNKKVIVGFNGSTCMDGKTRSGTITYDYSGSTNGAKRYRHPGFKMIVTSNNYVVNNHTVNINSKTVTNVTPVGFNPLTTNETWSITANITINKSGGGSISWNCNRMKTLLNTAAVYTNSMTPINWPNARIGFTGSAGGTRSNGDIFTVNITNQLIRDLGLCTGPSRHVFIQGTFDYAVTGKNTRSFNYGPGTCDLLATVTISGNTYTINL